MPHRCTACGRTFPDGSKEMLSGCPDCGGNKFQFRPDGAPEDEPATESSEPPDPPEPPARSRTAATIGRASATVRDWMQTGPALTDADDGDGADSDRDARDDTRPLDGSPAPGSAAAGDDAAPARGAGGGVEGGDGAPARAGDAGAAGGAGATEAAGVPGAVGGARDARDDGDAGDGRDVGGRDADDAEEAPDAGGENAAQADARRAVVSPDELPPADAAGSAGRSGPRSGRGTGADADVDADGPSPPASPEPSEGRVVGRPTGERPDLAELRRELNQQFESIKVVEPGQYELNLMELYDRDEYIIALQEDGRYTIQVPDNWTDDG